jgi:hypothetical protein
LRSVSVQRHGLPRLPRVRVAAVALALAPFWFCSCAPTGSSDVDGGSRTPDIVESTQERGPVRFTARAVPGAITVGDKLTLTLEVEAPPAIDIEMPELAQDLGAFTIRSARTTPDIPDGDVRRWTHRYTLDTFASGELEIPSLEVGFIDRRPETLANGSPVEGTLTSEPLLVTVKSVLTGDEQEGDYRDIRDAVDVPLPIRWRAYWPLAAAIIIIGGVVLVLLWNARRRKARTARERIVPPHIRAGLQLDALEREGLPEQGRFHEFYVRLSDIVRQYIEQRFGLRAPERTTEEFLRETRDDPLLSREQKDLLAGFLRAADMVKFARREPAIEECRAAFASARGFIDQTAPAPGLARPAEPHDDGTEDAA